MPKLSTARTPEWRGQVSILDGKYWRSFNVVVSATHFDMAARRAAQQAKLGLKKHARCHEIVVKLRRMPPTVGVQDAAPES